MKKVLILGNSKLRLKQYNIIANFHGEIWVCNTAFQEYHCLPRVDRVGTVHLDNALKAIEFKKENKLNYKVYCNKKPNEKSEIKLFSQYKGWSTGNEMIRQALIEKYDVSVLGFGSLEGENTDIYQKKVVISNFVKQYKQIILEFGVGSVKNLANQNATNTTPKTTQEKARIDHLFVDDSMKNYVNRFHNFVNISTAKKVLIVGNSPLLLEKEYGKIINTYDYVVRLNDYVIDGYEPYVGSKTDCFFTGAGHKTKIKQRDISKIDCIVAPGSTQFRNSKRFLKEKIEKALGIKDNDYVKVIDQETSKKIHQNIGVKYGTTGMQAIGYFAFLLGKDVTVAGFDFFQIYRNHYYDNKAASISSSHNLEREKLIYDNLVKEGKIKVLFDSALTTSRIIGNKNMSKDELALYNTVNPDKVALFSLITDNYLEPFAIFIKSLLKHNPWFNQKYLILDLDLTKDVKKKIKMIYENVEFVKVKNMKLYNKINMSVTSAALKSTYYKLELFNLKGYDKIIMVDVDMLVVGDISGLVYDRREGILGCKCYNDNVHSLSKFINTGVVIITKRYLNEHTYHRILEFTKQGFNLPDQKAINFFFKDKIKYLCKKYNVEKRMIRNTNKKIVVPENDVRIWHYVGSNPWDINKPARDIGYEKVENLWHTFRQEIKEDLQKIGVWK